MFGIWLSGNLWNKDCLVSDSAISTLMDFYFMTLFNCFSNPFTALSSQFYVTRNNEETFVSFLCRVCQEWNTKRDIARGPLSQLDIHESMGPDRKHPRALRSSLVSSWGPSLSSLRDHGSWGRILVTGKSVRVDIQSSEVWTGWSAEIPSYVWDSVIVCLYRGVTKEVCQLFKTLHSAPLIHCLGKRNSTGRQVELFNRKLH